MTNSQKIQHLRGYSVANRPALTNAQFGALTASLASLTGQALPALYSAFLHDFGAFAVDATIAGKRLPVSIFWGFTLPTDAYDLRRAFETFHERIPDGALPVALDDGGSLFLLDLKSGAVSFFDHETERVEALAPDFSSFLESLEPLPDDDLDE